MKTTIVTLSYYSAQTADRVWFRLEKEPQDETARMVVETPSKRIEHGTVDRASLLHMRDTLNEVLADWQP